MPVRCTSCISSPPLDRQGQLITRAPLPEGFIQLPTAGDLDMIHLKDNVLHFDASSAGRAVRGSSQSPPPPLNGFGVNPHPWPRPSASHSAEREHAVPDALKQVDGNGQAHFLGELRLRDRTPII